MRLNKKILLIASFFIATAAPTVTFASGIPTVDVASILQMAENAQEQAKEALAQLDQAKAAIAQAKGQYEHYKSMVQGNSDLADFLNDPGLNSIIPTGDWLSIYNDATDMSSLRSKYGLTSTVPEVQAQFDKLLAQVGVLEKMKSATDTRVKDAKSLRGLLNSADTPQQKADLGLRYDQERLELQNQQLQLENTKMLMDEKAQIDDKKKAQAFEDYMDGKAGYPED